MIFLYVSISALICTKPSGTTKEYDGGDRFRVTSAHKDGPSVASTREAALGLARSQQFCVTCAPKDEPGVASTSKPL